MNIRVATKDDVSAVTQLAQSLKSDPRGDERLLPTNGFLVYVLEEVDYLGRLNPYFSVAEEGEIVGFLMCYTNSFLRKLILENQISHEDGIVRFLQRQKQPFLYGDQIGILRKNQGVGVGKKLLQDMCERMILAGIQSWYVSVMHHPITNQNSIKFVTDFGFCKVGEVQNQDGLMWGMYHLDLGRVEKVDEFEIKPQF